MQLDPLTVDLPKYIDTPQVTQLFPKLLMSSLEILSLSRKGFSLMVAWPLDSVPNQTSLRTAVFRMPFDESQVSWATMLGL